MPKTKIKVYPASMLRNRALEIEFERLQELPESTRLRDAHNVIIAEKFRWEAALKEFRIPGVIHWPEGCAPTRVIGQLFGQVIDTGMTIMWHGQKYLVADLDVRPQELYHRFTLDHLTAYRRAITIVPLKYIDLDA